MKPLIWSILAILPVSAFAAEVFVSIDENGQVIYSDRPTGSEQEEVLQIRTGSQSAAAPVVADAAPATDSEPTAPEGRLMVEVQREPTSEERAANCEIARERAQGYSQAHRMFREQENGERVYLTSEEIDETRATAEAVVAEWCD